MPQPQTEILDLLRRWSLLQPDKCLSKDGFYYMLLPDAIYMVYPIDFHNDGTLINSSEGGILLRLFYSIHETDCPMWLSPTFKGGEWRAAPLGCPDPKVTESASPLLPLLSAFVEWLEQEQERKEKREKTDRSVAENLLTTEEA